MEQITPTRLSYWPSVSQIILGQGIFGPIFLVIATTLVIWLGILFFRARPLLDYYVFIAASFYPLLLGISGGSLAIIQFYHDLPERGNVPAGVPVNLATDLGHFFLRSICAGSLTCFFLPLGILALMLRKQK
jgi:hypothetical protein